MKAVVEIPSGQTRGQVLNTIASDFYSSRKVYETKSNLREVVGKDFYDYALWLTKNRNTFSVKEVLDITAKMTVTKVSNFDSREIDIWDNLFYQIFTSRSSYIREAILSLLVARFFVKNIDSARGDDDVSVLRKLAQARVILPKILFGPEDNADAIAKSKEIVSRLPKNNKGIQEATELLIIQNRKRELEDIKNELQTIEKKYFADNQIAIKQYDKIFESDTKKAYTLATKIDRSYTDKVTGMFISEFEYVDLVLPIYTFEPVLQLDYFMSKVTKDNFSFDLVWHCVNVLGYTTFQEGYDFIDKSLSDLMSKQFQRSETSKRVANVDGVVIVANSNISSSYARTTAGFNITSMNYNTHKILALTFDGMEAGTDIVAGNYQVDIQGITVEGIYQNVISSSEWINGKLVLKILNYVGHYFSPDSVGQLTITGTFTSSTGRDLKISGSATIYNTGGASYGSQNYLADLLDTSIYSGSSGSVVYNATGRGTYSFEDLPSAVSGTGNTNDTGSGVTDASGSTGNTNNNSAATTETHSSQSVIQYIPSGYGIKRLGIADYRKVEQEVCCYVPGEVSHIENVMAREYKEKSTRRMRRQEDTTTTSKEKETEKLSDSTTTDRFEMNQEVSSVMAEDTHIGANMSFQSKLGFGELTVGADFAHNTSQETSNHQAVTNAKEVTERVLDRVVQKVKEERVTKIIEEYEETDKHGYDNRKGNQHISGVYRWVDKIYRNQVINYGKRLMYEFMIPEPATFHTKAIERKIDTNGVDILEKPLDPRLAADSIKLALDSNFDSVYSSWASKFNAEINAMPENEVVFGKSLFVEQATPAYEAVSKADSIKIDERYYSVSAKATMAGHDDTSSQVHVATVLFGDLNKWDDVIFRGISSKSSSVYETISKYKGEVPISIQYYNYHTGCVNVSVKCRLSDEAKTQWQIETFNAIIKAYEDKLKAYNDKMEELKGMQSQKLKINPLYYRQVENMVLRKNCIEYMITHEALGGTPLVVDGDYSKTRVKYDSIDLETYSATVKFFEQAFEWNLMSYNFYPFYWAEKSKWQDLYNVEEVDDPIFRSFLQSGMARVIVTVKPGFEEVVNWYMGTGQVWNGGQVPTMDDPLFVSIVKELSQPEGKVEETWESRVPTSLTVIQAGTIGLNVEGLPCDDDCADYKVFDSDGHQVFNADSTPKSSNPIAQSLDEHGNPIQMGNITDELETVSESINEIKADIEEIKTTLAAGTGGN